MNTNKYTSSLYIRMFCIFSVIVFAIYLFSSLTNAQVTLSPMPCSDTNEPEIPSCGDTLTAQAKPITLEQVFADDFSQSVNWSQAGSVKRYTGTPRGAGSSAVLLCKDGSITKNIPLTNKGNHVFITFRMGAYRLETKEDPGRPAPAPSAKSSVARPVPPAMRAEYHDGTAWLPLATTADGPVNENQERDAYAFYLPSLNDPSRFKLRFRIEGSDAKDCGYVDDVAVWTARVVPPPSPAPR